MSKLQLIQGDCLDKLKELADNSVDSIVTDPPYELGFMGKSWDNTGIANNSEMWAECLRVLKPGGHLLSFGGTRTYHRMAVAIEDAGFEIRDMINWCYGSGFPKSLNIGKAVDKLQGNERKIIGYKEPFGREGRNTKPTANYNAGVGGNYTENTKDLRPIYDSCNEWEGWGTALKPAHEPIVLARKPLSEKTIALNVLKWGTGGINIDESRVGIDGGETHTGGFRGNNGIYGTSKEVKTDKTPQGRFPANLIHDNSEEVRECFPDTNSKGHNPAMGKANPFGGDNNNPQEESYFNDSGNASRFFKSIVYIPKASKSERNMGCEELEEKQMNVTETNARTWNDRCKTCGKKFVGSDDTICHCPPELKITDKTVYTQKNNHPTVKPVALMEYLIKMVTPKGGIVLDPFMGSGTTGIACRKLNYGFIGIELEPDYITIAKARIDSIKAVQEKLL